MPVPVPGCRSCRWELPRPPLPLTTITSLTTFIMPTPTTIYINGRFFTAAPESDIPIRRSDHQVHAQEIRQLRDALVDRRGDLVQALAPLLSEKYGIPKTVHLGTKVAVPYRGKPTRSLGWLPWAVWHESHGLNGGEYSETTPSSGCVEALLEVGLFDWDALRLFPNQRWARHPAFQALERACLDHLARLPKGHRLLRGEGLGLGEETPYPPAHRDDFGAAEIGWLGLAVKAGRLDAVQRWFEQGGTMPLSTSFRSTWRLAWERVFEQGRDPAVSDEARTTALAIVAILEHQVLARNVRRSWYRTPETSSPDNLRDEVLSLVGLVASRQRSADADHAPSQEALTRSLARIVQRWPMDLMPITKADFMRLDVFTEEGAAALLPPVAQSTLALLEQQMLNDALPPSGVVQDTTAPPQRRRL